MPRDYRVYLEDILRAAAKIRGYTEDLSKEAFLEDPKSVDAVIRNLEIIGEAAKQVPREVRMRCPDVEWERLGGLRDILIHAYFGIDLEIVWDIVENKIAALEGRIAALLRR